MSGARRWPESVKTPPSGSLLLGFCLSSSAAHRCIPIGPQATGPCTSASTSRWGGRASDGTATGDTDTTARRRRGAPTRPRTMGGNRPLTVGSARARLVIPPCPASCFLTPRPSDSLRPLRPHADTPSQRVQFILGTEDDDLEHVPHDLFTELDELSFRDGSATEWKETARFVVFLSGCPCVFSDCFVLVLLYCLGWNI